MQIKMRTLLLLPFFVFHFFAFSQMEATTGMNFEHLPSWKEVLAKAKKENKMVFLDCYTTWCGPCKMMSAKVFPQKEVGEFYNANFVNAKVQLDTTDNDNEYVKSWYKDGSDIAKNYQVNAYPTYLIFNGDGEIVHRFVGLMEPAKFIESGKDILNPDKQYYTLIRKYENGEKSPQLLLNLIKLAKESYDMQAMNKYIAEYMPTQDNLYTKDNLTLLYDIAKTSNDKGFQIALNEGEKADKILGAEGASSKLAKRIILKDIMTTKILNAGDNINWDAIDEDLLKKYPKYAKSVSSTSKMYYFQRMQNWNEFAKYADEVVSAGDVDPNTLNSFAWSTFENVSDKMLLGKALGWSKQSLDQAPNGAFMDTHANLLYKLGKTKEAIAEEGKAVELAKKEGDDTATYLETLEKMKKGAPTWPVKAEK